MLVNRSVRIESKVFKTAITQNLTHLYNLKKIKVISFCPTHHILKDESDPFKLKCARAVQSFVIFQSDHAENNIFERKFGFARIGHLGHNFLAVPINPKN